MLYKSQNYVLPENKIGELKEDVLYKNIDLIVFNKSINNVNYIFDGNILNTLIDNFKKHNAFYVLKDSFYNPSTPLEIDPTKVIAIVEAIEFFELSEGSVKMIGMVPAVDKDVSSLIPITVNSSSYTPPIMNKTILELKYFTTS